MTKNGPIDEIPAVTHLFAQAVNEAPDRVALEWSSGALSAAQLAGWAGNISRRLIRDGIRPSDRVAVASGRSPGAVAALLGVLAAGGVIVPLDRSLPRIRRRLLLDRSGSTYLVAVGDEPMQGLLPGLAIEEWPTVDLDGPFEPVERGPRDPAYVFFTSGSTGVPKGVLGSQIGLAQFMTWMSSALDVTPDDRVSLMRSLSFDAMLREVFLPLVTGATLVLAPDPLDPDEAVDWIAERGITILNATPSHVAVWLDSVESPVRSSLRWVCFSGERLDPALVRHWRSAIDPAGTVANLYGPTETTLIRTFGVVADDPGNGPLPVGRALPHSRIHVVRPDGTFCDLDEPGEVLIATEVGTLGYLEAEGRDLFIPEPGSTGAIAYRTGDRGWLSGDGQLVVSGRLDDQVQILGVRIEPDEVASVLSLHPDVDRAVVLAIDDDHLGTRLVAFVRPVDRHSRDDSDWRAYLSERVMSPAVPSRFISIDSFPLTANGKIDRVALLELAAATRSSLPSSAKAERIAALSPSRRLLLEASLPGSDAATQSRTATPTSVSDRRASLSPVQRALFDARLKSQAGRPELRSRVAGLSAEHHRSVVERLRARVESMTVRQAPLSFAQERLWFLDQLHPDRANYNITRPHRIRGSLDEGALRMALDHIQHRHETLRTRYSERDGEPIQMIDPPGPAPFQVIDLVGRSDAEEEMARLVDREAGHVFDLANGPVWRATLIRLASDDHALVMVLHHIASDGWSLPPFFQELRVGYAAGVEGAAADLPVLPVQYADYALRQREMFDSGGFEDDLAFWHQELEGVPELLSLPGSKPRPVIPTHSGARVQFQIPAAPNESITGLCRVHTVTPFMVGLALLQGYIARASDHDDIVIGVPSADRVAADTQNLIGFFVNTLAMRSRIEPDMTFRDLLTSVRDTALRAYDHREVAFEHVVQRLQPVRSTDRSPIFQVMYQFGTGEFSATLDLPGLESEPIERDVRKSKFDLTMYLGIKDGVLAGSAVYTTDLFDVLTIESLLEGFAAFSAAALLDPDRAIEDLPITTEPESATSTPTESGRARPEGAILGSSGTGDLASRLVDEASSKGGTTQGPSGVTTRAPLSFAQRRLWFLDRLYAGAGNYHTPWRVRLRGELSIEALSYALDVVVKRHAVLRTRFVEENGIPIQVVDPPASVPLPIDDLSMVPEPERSDRLGQVLTGEARRPFQLSSDALIRARLIHLGPDDQVLSLVAHHIATDAESMAIIRRELGEAYSARLEGRMPVLPELPIQYVDFAVRQRRRFEKGADESLRWWLDTLNGAPQVLELPLDRVRPQQGHEGDSVTAQVEPETTTALLELARATRATPFMVLLTAFGILLHRYTLEDDLVVGIPSTERIDLDTEHLVGFFVNSLPIRIDVSQSPSFQEAIERVRDTTLSALAHRDDPFEAIVEHLDVPRDPSRTPLFQVMFDMSQTTQSRFTLPGLESVPVGVRIGSRPAKFDLRLHCRLGDRGLRSVFEYRTDLFDRASIEAMSARFSKLLAELVADASLPIDGASMLIDQDRTIIESDGHSDTRTDPRLIDRFRSVADRQARSIAIDDGKRQITYEELARSARNIGESLRRQGVRPGATVGLALPRSAAFVASMLGTLEAGAAYVPLDPEYPAERLATMRRDAQLSAVLHPGEGGHLAVDIEPIDPAGPILDPLDQVAYIMYTSGSTGGPKGVLVPERAISGLVVDPDYVSLDHTDVIAFASNMAFDAATFEIWGALLNGARLQVLDRDTLISPDRLAAALRQTGVTTMFVTTALFNTVVAHRPDAFGELRQLLFGGQAVDASVVRSCLSGGPPERLVHVYGPTETTTFATWYEVEDVPSAARTVPIGRPVRGETVRVLDGHGEPVALGVPGDLVVGGSGVALGYLGDPDKTSASFVARSDGEVEYHTGDRVRRRHDGAIEFLGRNDRQIKMRGFRIEPTEIEGHLAEHPAVQEAAVVPWHSDAGLRLAAYAVTASGVDSATLLKHLAGRLPPFMVPSSLQLVEALPHTPNGKLDEAALPLPTAPTAPYVPPTGEAMERMAKLWQEVLDVPRVGTDDDFFALGGHSLLAIQLFAGIERVFEISEPLTAIFEAPTLGALTSRVTGERPADPPTPEGVVSIQAGADLPPLFCLPPAGGNVLVYEPMARGFDAERPIYGVPALGTDGRSEPFRSIEGLAAHCERLIVEANPGGPYLLAGYSMGGLVAWEVARRLRMAGHEVPLLALIDARLVRKRTARERFSEDLRIIRTQGVRGRRVVGRRIRRSARRLVGVVRHGPGATATRALGRPLSPLQAGRRLTAAGLEATRAFDPAPYEGRVVYLRAGSLAGRWRRFADDPWQKVAIGGMEVIDVPGTHKGAGSVMHEPNAGVLARELRSILERDGSS